MNLLKSISAYLGVARSFHWVTGENQIMRHELEPQKKYIRDVDFPVSSGKQVWELVQPTLQVFGVKITEMCQSQP